MADLFSTSRSTVLLTGSQLVAMAAGFIAQITVARLLLPSAYGSFAVAMSVLVWIEPLVSGGLTIALAQAVSNDVGRLTDAVRWVKRIFLPYSLIVWAFYSVASGPIASVLGDSQLRPLLFIAGLELPFIAVLAASRELLMGLREAARQAAVISAYALLRAACIVALAAILGSPTGALAGNALAALAGAIFSLLLLRPSISRPPAPPAPNSSKNSLPAVVLRTGVPTLALLFLTQFALTIDLWTVKRALDDPQAVGWYAAGRSFAFVPYMAATGLNLALFPALCSELGKGNRIQALVLTREAIRVLLMALVPFCAIVAPTAAPLARLLFSEQFVDAALPIRWLTMALSCFSLVGTLQAVLIADGKALLNSLIAGALSVTAVALCVGLVPVYGSAGAAWAMTLTGAGGVLLLVTYVGRRLGAVLPLATAFRVGVASAGLYLLAKLWLVEGPWLIGQYLIFAGLYVLLLLALGEIRRADFIVARTVAANLWSMLRRTGRSDPT